MPNLDDIDLRPGKDEGHPPGGPAGRRASPHGGPAELGEDEIATGPRQERSGRRAVWVWAVVALAVVALVTAFWLMSRQVEPPAAVATSPPEPETRAPEDTEPPRSAELEAPLPPLADSDDLVRSLVRGLSSHPALVAWLSRSGLVRIFVASVENVGLGASPSPNLEFLRPASPYRAVERPGAGGTVLEPDPANYGRYDAAVEVFTSLDPARTASAYRRVHGLVQEAYAELGYPDQSFDDALRRSFEELLRTPVPDGPPRLERAVSTYRYADPRLEALSPAQKNLLRLGPEHARRVQAQLRRLANELGLAID